MLDRLRQATLYTNSSKRNIEMMVYEKCHQFWWCQLLAKLDQHTERIDNTAGYILTWDLLKKFYLKKRNFVLIPQAMWQISGCVWNSATKTRYWFQTVCLKKELIIKVAGYSRVWIISRLLMGISCRICTFSVCPCPKSC